VKEYVGGGRRRLWFDPDEIERMMEAELRKAALLPKADAPAVDVEAFIAKLPKTRMEQYAEGLPENVLGLTEFLPDGNCQIRIRRELSQEVDREDECPPGILGRWRATMAHEASHVLMHRILFLDAGQQPLFTNTNPEKAKALFRCSAADVLFRTSSRSDSHEVQANMGMAALLMPRTLFKQIATEAINVAGFPSGILPHGNDREPAVVAGLAQRFEVSKQAAAIRLQTLRLVLKEGEQTLF